MLIGAHVPNTSPLSEASVRGADCVQIFLSNPKGWAKPHERADAGELAESAVPIYVHAPYLINLVSANNKIRIPSRTNLAQTCEAAGAIKAAGVIVHGGHVTDSADVEEGFARWRKALEAVRSPVPLLLENTAGGEHAMSRDLETIGRLWEHIADLGIGFCLDTCHLHAAGEKLVGAVERIRDAIGRIDLVHCNDSKDEAGSGRDRHENLGAGVIDPGVLIEVVGSAGAPVICETPGGPTEQAADIAWLRERL
jgi:deoxyribonuclease IV